MPPPPGYLCEALYHSTLLHIQLEEISGCREDKELSLRGCKLQLCLQTGWLVKQHTQICEPEPGRFMPQAEDARFAWFCSGATEACLATGEQLFHNSLAFKFPRSAMCCHPCLNRAFTWVVSDKCQAKKLPAVLTRRKALSSSGKSFPMTLRVQGVVTLVQETLSFGQEQSCISLQGKGWGKAIYSYRL